MRSPWTSRPFFRKKARRSIECRGISRHRLYPISLRISDADNFHRIPDPEAHEEQGGPFALASRQGCLFAGCISRTSTRGHDRPGYAELGGIAFFSRGG